MLIYETPLKITGIQGSITRIPESPNGKLLMSVVDRLVYARVRDSWKKWRDVTNPVKDLANPVDISDYRNEVGFENDVNEIFDIKEAMQSFFECKSEYPLITYFTGEKVEPETISESESAEEKEVKTQKGSPLNQLLLESQPENTSGSGASEEVYPGSLMVIASTDLSQASELESDNIYTSEYDRVSQLLKETCDNLRKNMITQKRFGYKDEDFLSKAVIWGDFFLNFETSISSGSFQDFKIFTPAVLIDEVRNEVKKYTEYKREEANKEIIKREHEIKRNRRGLDVSDFRKEIEELKNKLIENTRREVEMKSGVREAQMRERYERIINEKEVENAHLRSLLHGKNDEIEDYQKQILKLQRQTNSSRQTHLEMLRAAGQS